MPELPEVARTAISLNNRLQDREILEVIIHSGRYIRHGDPIGLDKFRLDLPLKVESIKFYGKFILFDLIDRSGKKWWIWNTLGMSGGWRSEHSKHGHVELKTKDGSVFFTDSRNFGTIKFINSKELTEKKISSIGPNHLANEISDDLFEQRLMKFPESTMPEVLMNQNLIGGIGNYIKAEILYRAGISPHRKVKDLDRSDFSKLNKATAEVVRSSFSNGGASFRSYYGMDWEEGNFPFYFKVYGRDICEKGHKVIRENTLDGRATWWVPEIQK
jgi:formamidopyrimidine-DNA glycosylase